MAFPFDILVNTESGGEQPITAWEQTQVASHKVYQATVGDLTVSLLDRGGDAYSLRAKNGGEQDITGRILVRFSWDMTGYTLIPGVYYNGNNGQVKDIPVLHLPESPCFCVTLAAASSPCVLSCGEMGGRFYRFSPRSAAGWNGLMLDGAEKTLTCCIPAVDDDVFSGREQRHQRKRHYPHVWHPGDIVCADVAVQVFPASCPEDLFAYFWENGRTVPRYPGDNTLRPDAHEALRAVHKWYFDTHYYRTEQGAPVLKNAFVDFNNIGHIEQVPGWNTLIGWCSGTMAALPLLAREGEERRAALDYIDFACADGFAPSGVKYPVYDGHKWFAPDRASAGDSDHSHCRFYCDFLYYLGRAIRYEAGRGETHPRWKQVFADGIRILQDVWHREGDFGMRWDYEGEQVQVSHPGTGAGAFALLALAEGVRIFPEDTALREAALEAARVYYDRCVVTGRCGGGPNDIWEADDSESSAALTDALTQLYELTREDWLLACAVKAAYLFSSWVYAYAPPFPGGTPLEGMNVCGGVIANVQNRHIGPGICTNSARFLYDLGVYTGDERFFRLYRNVRCAALNCIADRDGAFFGETFEEMFRKGMVSEQINLYDVYTCSGFSWCVSAGWPITDILLSEFDQPEDWYSR